MIDHGFSTMASRPWLLDRAYSPTIDPGVTVVLTLDLHRPTTYAFIDFQTGEMTTGVTC